MTTLTHTSLPEQHILLINKTMESSSAVHWQSQSCKFRTPQTAPYISQGSGECLSYLPECKELSRKRKERQEAAKASQSSSNSRSPAGSCALTGERETKHTRTQNTVTHSLSPFLLPQWLTALQCRGPGFHPWSGSWSPRSTTKVQHACPVVSVISYSLQPHGL